MLVAQPTTAQIKSNDTTRDKWWAPSKNAGVTFITKQTLPGVM